MKDKHVKCSHISEAKFREVLRLFCEDLNAIQIANTAKVNRNTENRILNFCERVEPIEEESRFSAGEIEIGRVSTLEGHSVVF
jgi:transposase